MPPIVGFFGLPLPGRLAAFIFLALDSSEDPKKAKVGKFKIFYVTKQEIREKHSSLVFFLSHFVLFFSSIYLLLKLYVISARYKEKGKQTLSRPSIGFLRVRSTVSS